MKNLPTKEELLEVAKPMIVNLEVAKTMDKKSQTRRVIPFKIYTDANNAITAYSDTKNMRSVKATSYNILQKSVWKKGDVLWVREPVKIIEHLPVGNYGTRWHDCDSAMYQYLSDGGIGILLEIPERFKKIPKWIKSCQGIPNGCIKEMARDFRRVTNVRVERLQDITVGEIRKEGCPTHIKRSTLIIEWFVKLWNKTAPKCYKLEDNPWVFVYDFKKVEYQK